MNAEIVARPRHVKRWVGIIVITAFAVVYFVNASWLAPAPNGRRVVIAQRGLHQVYEREDVDDSTCTAKEIPPPTHRLIDNTLPAIEAAFAAGADVVEVDVRLTSDGHFVLFHDLSLECRTELSGAVFKHTLAELKAADVGYGYTADGGKTFPLRGLGVGLMPTLEEALRARPSSRFLIQFKDGNPAVGERMVRYLEERGLDQWDRFAFFGSVSSLNGLKSLQPEVRTWTAGSAARCGIGYFALGWAGYFPAQCEGGIVIVPVTQTALVWGWPNRFLKRMHDHRTEVMLIGKIDGLSGANFSRLDTVEELARVPVGFEGSVWTDRIEIVGPASMH